MAKELVKVEGAWSKEFDKSLVELGNKMSQTGMVLRSLARFSLVEGDEHYNPIPHIEQRGSKIGVVANIDAFKEWIAVLEGYLSGQEIQKLYLMTAASGVELGYVAQSAIDERRSLEPGKRAKRSPYIRRAMKIMKLFSDRAGINQHAEELEDGGVDGVFDLVTHGLTDRQVVEINRLRYGLGVGMYAMQLSVEQQNNVSEAFRRSLVDELEQRETSLLEFMLAMSSADKYADVAKNYEQIRRNSFPEFLFGGIIPMNITETIL